MKQILQSLKAGNIHFLANGHKAFPMVEVTDTSFQVAEAAAR